MQDQDKTKKTLQADPTNPPGPIQRKKINRLISRIEWASGETVVLSGVIGVFEYETAEALLFGRGDKPPVNPKALEALDAALDGFGWTVSKSNAAAIATALEDALRLARETRPVRDERRTLEADAERSAALADKYAQEAAKRAQADAQRDAAHAVILAKRPPRAAALIVAELDQDESDIMTDYFHARTVRRVAIGWRTGAREDFRQLRKAASTFKETSHLGTGCDTLTLRAWEAPDEGPNVLRRSRHLDGRTFPTEADAEGFALHLVTAAQAGSTDALDALGYDARQWAYNALRFGWETHSASVEHRDNYSMGRGNFLKAGSQWCSGWCVRSYPIRDNGTLGTTDALEDGIPDADRAPGLGEGTRTGTAYSILEGTNKRGAFALVVPAERVERDEFETLRASAKRAGGWYSRKWGKQAGGFGFDSMDAAHAWASATWSETAPEPPDGDGPSEMPETPDSDSDAEPEPDAGPWEADTRGGDWIIRNRETGAERRVGPVGGPNRDGRGTNYGDKARALADERNAAKTAEPDAEPEPLTPAEVATNSPELVERMRGDRPDPPAEPDAGAVIRYVVTHRDRDGMRTLSHAKQGRDTYETAEEAQAWIDAAKKQDNGTRLRSLFGEQSVGTFEVRECPCYPGHFDPMRLYFDEDKETAKPDAEPEPVQGYAVRLVTRPQDGPAWLAFKGGQCKRFQEARVFPTEEEATHAGRALHGLGFRVVPIPSDWRMTEGADVEPETAKPDVHRPPVEVPATGKVDALRSTLDAMPSYPDEDPTDDKVNEYDDALNCALEQLRTDAEALAPDLQVLQVRAFALLKESELREHLDTDEALAILHDLANL